MERRRVEVHEIHSYVATFGTEQYSRENLYLGDKYTVIQAINREEAQEIMYRIWGQRYPMIYDNEQEAGVNEHKLEFIETKLQKYQI